LTGVPGADELGERHARLLARLREITAANGYDPHKLQIVGVTKTHPVELARAALAAGITRLGESRIQEAEPKVEALPDAEWHFIGRLQGNKARRAVRAFEVIHSVDSAELLVRLDRLSAEEGRRPRLLIQVDVAGEARKAGLAPDELAGVTEPPRSADLVGLMTIAPMGASEEDARRIFGRLRQLRDELQERLDLRLPELSMGMSADAEAAACEGATLVRVGTALFGARA
jgi:hypothetical protein